MKLYKRLIQPRYSVEMRRYYDDNGEPKSRYAGSFELECIKEWFPEDMEPQLREAYEPMCERHNERLIFKEKFVEV